LREGKKEIIWELKKREKKKCASKKNETERFLGQWRGEYKNERKQLVNLKNGEKKF